MKITVKITEKLISRIYAGDQVFPEINKFLWNFCGKPSGIYVLVDQNTRHLCLPILMREVPCLENAGIIEVPAGEQNKEIGQVIRIWENLKEMGAIRHSLLVNLGGGMITDLGGFAASTFKRGIPFIHVPTSLMGMADAAIGGKTGVNLGGVKNQAGVYSNPEAVFIHSGFLETLPEEELMSGLAEVIKYALILDEPLWNMLRKMKPGELKSLSAKDPLWGKMIIRSVRLKSRVITTDYREKKYRRILNFGHTAGHALESLSLEPGRIKLTHGHAVALGMIIEAWISCREAGMEPRHLDEITRVVLDLYSRFPIGPGDKEKLTGLMRHDKKNLDSRFNFTLITGPGRALIDQPCDKALVEEALEFYMHLQG